MILNARSSGIAHANLATKRVGHTKKNTEVYSSCRQEFAQQDTRKLQLNNRLGRSVLLVKIIVAQERLNRTFGFCTIWKGGLPGYETVSTGSGDACAVRD